MPVPVARPVNLLYGLRTPTSVVTIRTTRMVAGLSI
jgi:hypothetical protein